MEEGEQKLCLVEPTLELMEKTPLQIHLQLVEKMEGGEALAAEEGAEAMVEMAMIIHLLLLLLTDQEQMQLSVELEVMVEAAEQEALEGIVMTTLQEREVQEVLAVLEEEAELEEMLG